MTTVEIEGPKKSKSISQEEREGILERFDESGLSYADFAAKERLNAFTLRWWLQERKKRTGKELPRAPMGPRSPEERKKTIEAYLKSGMIQSEFAVAWGVSVSTLCLWLRKYEAGGYPALEGYAKSKPGDRRRQTRIPQIAKDEIIELKKREPQFGFKKIKNWLYRFKGVKVSTGTISKTVKAEGLPLALPKRKRRRSSDRIRRFERAKPMQLWQSDITQFNLARTSARVYLTVFMDDHSRFIVGWRLQTRQTADLVIDCFKDAVSKFGKPAEVLTDQGRQYFAWRGKSDLEKLLEKEGIKHVVSRAHHPQTLGKCERFWETVGNEFWTRARPQDLEEARARMQYFIDHYNFHRPHQGLGGHCPADRFFEVTSEIRSAIEKAVEKNSLNIAIGVLPKPPAFLIGQIGDQKIAFHGTSGNFILTHENITGEKNDKRESNHSTANSHRDHLSNTNREAESSQGSQTLNPHNANAQAIPSDLGAGFMGSGDGGRAHGSPGNGSDCNGVLARLPEPDRIGEVTRDEADQVLASHAPGGGGNVCGVTDAAKEQQRERWHGDIGSSGDQKIKEEDPGT